MPITGSGNVFSSVPANERDSQYLVFEHTFVAAVTNTTSKQPLCQVPRYPGNVKLKLVQARFLNGATASTIGDTPTVGVYNDTNAEDAMATRTLVAGDAVACAGASYAPEANTFTLSTSTSDRSAVAGMSATEPDTNAAPADNLYIQAVCGAGDTITAGSKVQVIFQPVDVSGN